MPCEASQARDQLRRGAASAAGDPPETNAVVTDVILLGPSDNQAAIVAVYY
jgi:hypothetical protein